MPVTPTAPATTANAAAAAAGAPPEDAPVRAAAERSKTSKTSATSGKTSLIEVFARAVDPSGALPGLLRAFGVRGLTSVRRSSVAGYATAEKASSSASALSFLKDPKLSIEEKLIKLLGYLNAKWDKEMQDKLDKIAANEGASASASTSKPKSKGILGSVMSAFSGALGAVGGAGKVLEFLKVPAVKTALKKLGGPVLAAAASAFGFPAAAPILLKYGPDVVNAALGVASAAGGSAKTSQATSGTASNDSQRQTLMMEIQRIQEKQKEMFGLVSNILRANHDARMSIVGNIR